MKDYTHKIVGRLSLIRPEFFNVSGDVIGKLHRHNSRIFTEGGGRPLHILKRACDRSYDS